MKNRSNIAASILSRPDLLEEAYQRSLTSQGVAQQELDRYLDSLVAKTTQLHNRLTELASVSVSTDFLKDMVELGTGAVEVITSLVDKIGSLAPITGIATGVLSQAFGAGMWSQNQRTGKFEFLGSRLKQQRELKVSAINSAIADINGLQLNADDRLLVSIEGGMQNKLIQNNAQLKEMLGHMTELERSTLTVGQAQEMLNSQLSRGSGVFSTFMTSIKNVGSALTTAFITTAAIAAIRGIIKLAIDASKTSERLIEKGKDAKKAIQEINTEFNNTQKVVKDIDLDNYFKLTEKQGNGTATAEELQQIADVNNQLAGMFPTIVSGFDNQGNALVNLGSNAEEAAQKLSDLINQERELADYQIMSNLKDEAAGVAEQTEKLSKQVAHDRAELKNYEEPLFDTGSIQNYIDKQTKALTIDLGLEGFEAGTEGDAYISSLVAAYRNALSYNGINILEQDLGREEYQNEAGEWRVRFTVTPEFELNQDAMDTALEDFYNLPEIKNPKNSDHYIETALDLRKNERELKAQWNSIMPDIITSMKYYDDYDLLDTELQNYLSNAISSFDLTSLDSSDLSEFASAPRQFMDELFLQPLVDSIRNADTGELDKAKVELVKKLASHDVGDLTNEEIYGKNGLVGQITDNEDYQNSLLKMFGYFAEDGGLAMTKQRNALFEKLGGIVTGKGNEGHNDLESIVSWDDVKSLGQDYIKYILEGFESGELKISDLENADNPLNTLKEFAEKRIEELKNVGKDFDKDGKFGDIFKNESFTDSAKQYETALTAITGAIKKYNTEGKLSPADANELMETLQTGDVSLENLRKLGTENIAGYIADIREQITDDWDASQIQEAENYIESLSKQWVAMFDEVSGRDLSSIIKQTMGLDEAETTSERQKIFMDAESYLSQLRQYAGGDLDNRIVLQMALEGDFANFDGNMQDLYDRYDELHVQVKFDIDEAVLQALKDSVETRNNLEQSERDLKESNGEYLTSEDYEGTLRNDASNISILTGEYEKARNEYIQAYQAYSDELTGKTKNGNLDELLLEMQTRMSAMQSAEANLNEARTALAKDQEASRQADIDEITRESQELEQKKTQLSKEVESKKIEGFEKDVDDYTKENGLLRRQNAQLLKEKKLLEKDNRETDQPRLQEIDTELATNRNTIAENNKAIEDIKLFRDTEATIKQLEDQRSIIESDIASFGEEYVPQSYYESQGSVINQIIAEKGKELQIYQDRMAELESKYTEDKLLNNTDYSEASSKVAELTNEIQTLNKASNEANENSILSSFIGDLQSADAMSDVLKTMEEKTIPKIKQEISENEKAGLPTEDLYNNLTSVEDRYQLFAGRVKDIYQDVGNAFVDINEEKRQEWLGKSQEYDEKETTGFNNALDARLNAIESSTFTRDQKIGQLTTQAELLDDMFGGKIDTHENLAQRNKIQTELWKQYAGQFAENIPEYVSNMMAGISGDKSAMAQALKRQDILQSAISGMQSTSKTISENREADKFVDIKALEQQLTDAQHVQNQINSIIEGTSNLAPMSMFDTKGLNLEYQIDLVGQLVSEYDNLVKSTPEDDAEYGTYTEKLANYEEMYADLMQQAASNPLDAFNETLRRQGVEFDSLKQSAAEYQAVIDNPHHDATAQDYQNLINNGKQQIANLKEQITTWEQVDAAQGSVDWATAQSNINSLNNEITSITQNTQTWVDAINNLQMDKINQKIEETAATGARINAELESEGNKRDLGYDDYIESVENQTTAVREAEEKLGIAEQDLQNKQTMANLTPEQKSQVKRFGGEVTDVSETDVSNAVIAYENAGTQLIQAQDALRSTLTEQEESILSPLLTEYSQLEEESNTLASKIQSDVELLGFGETGDYEQQLTLSGEMIQNLVKQRDLWQQIYESRKSKEGTEDYSQKQVDAAESAIRSLESQITTMKAGRKELERNSIISTFNDQLKQAQGWEQNLRTVREGITSTMEAITLGEANHQDETENRGILEGLYENESYWAQLLEDLYNNIAHSLLMNGDNEGYEEYFGKAQEQHQAIIQANENAIQNDIAMVGIDAATQNQIDEAEQAVAKLKEQQQTAAAQGHRRTNKDIADSLASNQGLRDLYDNILKTELEPMLESEDYANKSQVATALDSLISTFTSKIASIDQDISSDQKEQDLQFVDSLQDRLTAYETRGKEISDTIAQLNEEEKYVSDELYDEQYKNFDRQIRGNEILQKLYENAAKIAGERNDKDSQQVYEEQAASIGERIRNLATQMTTNRNQKRESEQQQLQYQLDEYQRQGDALQATLDRVGHVATKQDYKDLIKNSQDQVSVLQSQREYWEEYQKDFNVTDRGYQEAAQYIAQIDSAIQSATNSQLQWNEEINNLPYQKYENLLNLSKSIQNINNAENNKKSAFGFDLLPEDYESNIEQMTEDVENAKHELGVANAKLLQAGDNVFNGYKLDENGEKIEGLTKADLVAEEQQAEIERNEKQAAVLEAETALWMEQQKKKEAETANSIGRLNDLKQEATEIQNDIDNITTKGGMRPDSGLYQGLIDNMNNQIDEMIIQRNVKLRQQQELENNEFLKSIGDPKNTNIYRTLTSEIEELNQDIFNGGESIKGWQAYIVKSGRQNEIDGYLARIEDYERKIADKKREIAKAERDGGDTGTLYSELASLYGSEKFQKEGLQNLYKNIAEAFRTGDNIDLVQATAFDDLARELDDGVENLDASADEATKKTLEISDEIQDSINSLTDSRSLNESFQKYRESLGGIADEAYYEQQKSISEGLEKQYRQALSDLKEKYDEIVEPTEDQKLDYDKKRKELLSNIFGEQAQQEEYETAEDLLPVKDLEDQAEQYQNVLTELQNSFDEFTEHGGIITDDLYKDQKQTYSDLEGVYENIAKEYDKLADSEKNLEKQNGFRKQAEEARESARQYKDAQKDIDDTLKARQGKSTFSLLLENESDEGISKVTEQFTSQMDSIHELEEQYRTGESIDIGEIKVKFPRISGIENLNELPEALGEVKTDAITQYLDDYVNVISKYPDAIGEAQQFLVDTMTGFDFKNVNVDRVMKSLTDVFGQQAIKGLISEKDAFSILDQVRSILESGGDAGVAISVAMKAAFEEGYDPNSVVDDYNDLEITVKLKSDVTELENEIAGLQGAKELNDTVGDLESSKRSYNETQRGFAIPEDFDGEITANANDINILTGEQNVQEELLGKMFGSDAVKSQFETFINDIRAKNIDESNYDDLTNYIKGNSGLQDLAERIESTDFTQSGYTLQSLIDRYKDLQTTMTDVQNAQTEGVNLSNQQRDAISNEADQWANFYNALSEGAKQEVDNITNTGGRATEEQYNNLAKLARDEIASQNKLLEKESEKYESLFDDSGEFIGNEEIDITNVNDANNLFDTINEIKGKINTLTQSEAEFVGQAMMAQGNAALEKIDELDYAMTNAIDGYDTQIKSLQADNKDVSLDLLSSASGNLDEQIAQYKELAELADSIHDMYANPESEYYNEGLAKQYDDMARGYQDKLEQAQQQQRDYGEYILNNAPSIQERVNELNRERNGIARNADLRKEVEGLDWTKQDYIADNLVSQNLIKAYEEQKARIESGEALELNLELKTDSVEEAKDELTRMITEEEGKIAQNNKAINDLSITEYEGLAERLATQNEDQTRAIKNSIRDKGYADTSLYEDLQKTLEYQKIVQDTLAGLNTYNANLYDEESGYYAEYTSKANAAKEASDTFTESLQTNQQAIEDSIDNTPFQSILQNTEGIQNVKSVTDDLQTVIDAVDEYRTMIEDGEEIDWTNLVSELPELTGIAAGDIESLSSALDDLELKKLDAFSDDYSDLLKNLKDPQQRAEAVTYMSNLLSDIDLSQVDSDKIRSKIQDVLNNAMSGLSPEEGQGLTEIQDYINSYLGAGGSEEVALMVALEAAWMGLTPDEAVAQFDNLELIVKLKLEKSELEKDIAKASREIEKNNSKNEAIKSDFGLKESFGYTIDKDEYGALLEQDKDNIRQAELIYNNRSRLYDISKQLFGEESSATSDAFIDMQNAYKDYIDSQEGFIQDTISYEEANNDRYESNLSKLQATASDVQGYLDRAVEDFGTGTAEQYQFLLQNAALQAVQYGAQLSEWQRIRDENSDGKGIDNMQLYTDALEGISSVNEAMAELKASTLEWQLMLNGGIELGQLDSNLSDLEEIATAISDAGSIREGKGLTKTLSQYEALVENGESQIENLHEQNRILQRQQNTLGITRSRWREIQSTINGNNSAIAQMRNNIADWNASIRGYNEALGRNMLDALTNAFSESMSPTGLTTSGMDAMLAQFADLSGFDTSAIFYNTAQGIKLDVDATKMLVDAQYQLRSGDLKEQIDKETEAYKDQVEAMKSGGDAIKETARIQAEAHRQNLDSLWQQLAQYQALYAQEQYLFSDLADVERALSSENAGAKYEQIQGYGENYKKLYESGLVGTDDFKEITALLTQYGRTTEAAYEEATANLDRYFTEDISGVVNFFNDLVSKGYATGSAQEGYDFAGVIDEVKAAGDLGITTEVFDYLLGRSEDYGASIQAVKSEIDGQLKLQETQHDILDSIERKNELMSDPRAATALQEEQEHLESLRSAYDNYTEGIEMEATKANQITSQQIQTGVNIIKELGEEWDKAVAEGDERYQHEIENKIREISEKYGAIPLQDIEGKLTVDTDALNAQYEGWAKTVASSFSEVSPDFIREGFDISKDVKDTETWESAIAKVQENYSSLTDEGDTALQQLQALNLSAKELSSIDMTDGMLDSDTNLAQAEKLLDTLADMAGLTGEERQNMSSVLDMFGLIGEQSSNVYDKQSNIVEQIQDNMETVNDLIESQQLQADFEIKDVGDLSIQGLENQIKNLEELKASIDIEAEGGEETIQAIDSILDNNNTALVIKTELEGADDARSKLLEMAAYSDEEIMAKLEIDADTEGAEAKVESFRANVDSLISQDISVRIQAELEGAVDAQAKLEEMRSWDDTTIMQFLEIDANTENASSMISDFRSQIESADAAQMPVTIKLDDAQYQGIVNALTGNTLEIPVSLDGALNKAKGFVSSVKDLFTGLSDTPIEPEVTTKINVEETKQELSNLITDSNGDSWSVGRTKGTGAMVVYPVGSTAEQIRTYTNDRVGSVSRSNRGNYSPTHILTSSDIGDEWRFMQNLSEAFKLQYPGSYFTNIADLPSFMQNVNPSKYIGNTSFLGALNDIIPATERARIYANGGVIGGIEGNLAKGQAMAQELLKLDNQTIMATIGCEASEVEDVKSTLKDIAGEPVESSVKVDDSELTKVDDKLSEEKKQGVKVEVEKEALNSLDEIETKTYTATLKTETDTSEAEDKISDLEKETHTITIETQTQQIPEANPTITPTTIDTSQLQMPMLLDPKVIEFEARLNDAQLQSELQNIDGEDKEIEVDAKVGNVDTTALDQAGGAEIEANAVVDTVDTSMLSSEEATISAIAEANEADTSGIGEVVLESTAQVTGVTGTANVEASINAPTDTNVNVTATVTGKEQVDELKASIDSVEGKTVDVTAIVTGTSAVLGLKSAIDSLYSKSVTASATTSGLGELQSMKSMIDSIQSKTVTVTTITNSISTSSGNSGGSGPISYSGTLLSPAFARGTLPDNALTNVQHIGHGKVGLAHNEKSVLVNEIGDESYITPDGKWKMFQSGMHVEKNLKKGTIILNHEQTESLIKSGKAAGRGQIQGGMNAFASGTDKVLMNAYASGNEKDVYIDPTNVYIVSKSVGGHFTLPASYNGGGGSSDSGGGSDYSGGGDSGGSSGGGGGGDDSGDTPQFSYEIFDHVERALDLLARSVDNAAKKIQDYMTPFSRKTLIKDQIEKLEKQFDGVNKAIETYRGYLSVDGHDMLHAYEYADDDGNKATVDIGQYFDLDDLRNGNLTKLQYIDTTDPAAKAAVEGAQKWLEYLQKAEDAEDQLLDIISDIHDAALQIMEIPLDELDKTLEKLDSTISHINSMIDIISSNGATGIHMLKRAVNEGTGYRDAANAYTTAKANYTEARSNVSQSKANIKELTSIQKEANSDLTSSQKTLTKALKKSNLSKKDKDAIKERMNKGKKVSTKGITDKTLKDAIKVWNANIVTTRTVQEGLKDAQAELSKNTKAQREAKKQMQKALEQRKSIRAGLSPEERAVAGASISKPWYVAANEWVDASTESTRQKVEEARATLAAQQKITDEQKKQSDEAGKQLLASQNLTKEQRKQIQSGEKLDITENMTEAELKLATIYNLFFEALELFNDAKTQLEDTEIEYAEALMNQIEQHYNNLKDYYDDLRDWNGTLRENLESTNDLIGKTGRSYQTSGRLNINRQLSMGYLETDIQLAEEEIKKLQEEVDSEVASGDLIVGDKVWHDRMKPIYELQVQINKTKVDIIDLYTEMANVPVEDATSKIEELRESLKRLTTFGDKGLGDTIQLQRTYYEVSRNNFAELVKQAEKQLGKNSQAYKEFSEMQEKNLKETRKYSGGEKANDFAKTFLGQNDYLETQVSELKKEMQIRQDTLLKTEKELQNLSKVSSGEKSLAAWSNRFLGNRDTDKYGGLITALKKYKTGGSTFYSIFKDYIDAGAQIDKNSEEVDTILNYKKLSDEQKELLEYLISHYNRAVNNFDVYNAKLFAAETANNQALADFYEAQADYVKAKANLVSNQLSNINTYMETLYGRTKTYSETFESIRDELKEIGYDDRGLSSGINYDSLYGEGTGQIAKSYENQIKYLEKYASQVSDSIKYQIEVIRKAQEDGSLVKDSEDWKKAWNTINSLEGQVRSTVVEIDKLYHEMQDTVIFKPIRDAIDDIQRLRSNISSVLDLISDDMKLTKDGDFTELGLASLTGQLSSYQSTLEEIEKTLEYQRKLTDEYNRQETITSYTVDSTTGAKTEIKRLKYTTEEYTEAMKEAQKQTQDALKNAQTYRTQIINAITTRYKTEIDYISELIDKRKEALQKQKEMNDYDKTLKNKTNEIQKIEQQIRALETLSDIESKAQKKRLEAELQEQQQDLDDTIQEHVYDLRTEGLDDIKQELQDNYEKFTKDLQINIDSIIKTINDSAGNIEATLDGTNRVISSFLSTFNTNLGLDSLGAEEFTKENTTAFKNLSELQENANDLEHYNENYSARQYETLKEQQAILESTKDIESDIYGNTEKILQQTRDYNYSLSAIQDASERNADGGFVTANGTVLTPLDMIDVNDSFIDALLKASENANMFRGVPVNNGFDEFGGNNIKYDNRNISNNVNVGSLITVNGNVGEDEVAELQRIANGLANNKNFLEATYTYALNEQAKEARKSY